MKFLSTYYKWVRSLGKKGYFILVLISVTLTATVLTFLPPIIDGRKSEHSLEKFVIIFIFLSLINIPTSIHTYRKSHKDNHQHYNETPPRE